MAADPAAFSARPSQDCDKPGSGLFGFRRDHVAIFVAVTFAVYTITYLHAKFLPGNPAQPLGWWSWADQGHYLKSARSFADGSWRQVDHFYPPVYPWLGSWFVRGAPGHPFFVVDYLGFVLHLGSLLVVGRSLCGTRLSLAAIVATMALFPDLTLQHWAEPWTTSVSAGLGAVMILAVWHFDRNGWRLDGWQAWAVLLAACFAFGALAGVRPLDVLVHLPLMTVVILRLGWTLVRDRGWKRACVAAAAVLIAGGIVPALFITFNVQTSGTIVGSYIVRSRGVGYEAGDLARKFVSLLFDSATVYAEPKQTIAARFWPLFVTLPTAVGMLFWAKLPARLLALTVLLQVLVYLPYADLTPTSLYRYANVHYFKWTFPWLVLLTVAQVRTWSHRWPTTRTATLVQAGIVTIGVLCACALTLAVQSVVPASLSKAGPHSLGIDLGAEHAVDFIDLPGLTGGIDAVFNTVDGLEADGAPLRWLGDFRLLPIMGGARLVFGRPRRVHELRLTLDPAVTMDGVGSEGRAVAVGYALTCRIARCPDAGPSQDGKD